MWRLLISAAICWQGAVCDRVSECSEVGFARSAGNTMHQGFEAAKEALLQAWTREDAEGVPPYSGFTDSIKNVTRSAALLEAASLRILEVVKKTRVGKRCNQEWLLKGLEKHVVPLMNLDKQLAEQLGLIMSFRCMLGSPYPNVDGTCVNAESPDLGAMGSKFLRLHPAQVDKKDGFGMRASASDEKVLPSAREVANFLRRHLQRPAVTAAAGDWGHFIQRDTFSIGISPWTEGVDCCQTPDAKDCAPIAVSESDPLYKTQPCIDYKRSAVAQAILGHREALTMVSTYLDATPVYGPTNEVAFHTKTGYFGYLKTPEVPDEDDAKELKCAAPEGFEGCFGVPASEKDAWVEGLPLLLTYEHNRIVDALAELNPHFDDSLLYNEARRALIAAYNYVTYNEYLPLLMGEALIKKHSLEADAEGAGGKYIKEVNPGILNNFATVAFRTPMMDTEWSPEQGMTDKFLSHHYASSSDHVDALALDVQRARDHGVAGYLTWLRFCDQATPYHTWEDLAKVLGEKVVAELRQLYNEEIDDLDPAVLLLERPDGEALLGRTQNCLISDQFARLKTGNRLFWEHEASSLTEEQKAWVKSSSLARLLCSNLPLEAVPKNAFLPPSESNPLVACSELPPVSMEAFKDTSLIEKMKEINAKKEAEARAVRDAAAAGDDEASVEDDETPGATPVEEAPRDEL